MRNLLLLCVCIGVCTGAVSCKSKKKPETAAAQTSSFSAKVKDRIDDYIDDDVRKQRLIKMLDGSEACIVETANAYVAAQQKLNGQPNLTRESADKILGTYRAIRDNCVHTIVDTRVALRGEVSAKEWTLIFAPPKGDKDKESAKSGVAAPESETADDSASAPEEDGAGASAVTETEDATEVAK